MYDINILIACEESQAICSSFRNLGFSAYSLDIQDCSGSLPEYHIKSDLFDFLFNTDICFDLIIAHPPCTYLSRAGSCRLFNKDGSIKDFDRFEKGLQAAEFFMKIYNLDIPHIAIENPIPLHIFNLPSYSQIIQPYNFGDPYSKATCLWLKNLPPLMNTCICSDYKNFIGNGRIKGVCSSNPKLRSKTFPGIAAAISRQWGFHLLNEKGIKADFEPFFYL